ncbi:MAG: hypothetical protein NXI23_06285 [Bacteroidetes bacterium]|jgi:hypothetical protein|nr:hypothetical protein [Bacteroidota bacterium]MDF1867439.1 hypothetical protein [Saprospiraceae bacterium]
MNKISEEPSKKKLMGGFEKFTLIVFLLIMFFVISDKLGCSPIQKEETVEWTR